jgi:hypothetical protein
MATMAKKVATALPQGYQIPPTLSSDINEIRAVAKSQSLLGQIIPLQDPTNRVVRFFSQTVHQPILEPVSLQALEQLEFGQRIFARLVPSTPVASTAQKISNFVAITYPLGDIVCFIRNTFKLIFGVQGPVVGSILDNLGGGAGITNSAVGTHILVTSLYAANEARKIQDFSWMNLQLTNALSGLSNAAAGACWTSLLFLNTTAVAFAGLDAAINPLFGASSVLSGAISIYKLKNLYTMRKAIKELTKLNDQIKEQKLAEDQKKKLDKFLIEHLFVTDAEFQKIKTKVETKAEKNPANKNNQALKEQEINRELNRELENLMKRKFFKFAKMTSADCAKEAVLYFLNGKKDLSVTNEASALIEKIEKTNHKSIATEFIKLTLAILGVIASVLFIVFPAGMIPIYVVFALCALGYLYYDLSFFHDKLQFAFLENKMIQAASFLKQQFQPIAAAFHKKRESRKISSQQGQKPVGEVAHGVELMPFQPVVQPAAG